MAADEDAMKIAVKVKRNFEGEDSHYVSSPTEEAIPISANSLRMYISRGCLNYFATSFTLCALHTRPYRKSTFVSLTDRYPFQILIGMNLFVNEANALQSRGNNTI